MASSVVDTLPEHVTVATVLFSSVGATILSHVKRDVVLVEQL